ncbi:DUF5103 domain-containing protein [Muriicola sp.]|uniref:type IX secretion system plug protein n=1 Tax=Muriicola sp. TaxID=2020856 RepID=UPI003C74E447
MRLFLKHLFLCCFVIKSFAQVQEEVNPPENIKSIIFRGETEDQFPVVQLGDDIYLEFDDLLATEQDYYYSIIHCDYDWTPSQLLKSQYLVGIDNQRIINYENSYSTLQPYSNYQLTIPNTNVRLKVSGNYVLEIYNSSYELQFSRRFVVYQNLVRVAAVVRRSRDFEYLDQKQSVQFSISSAGFPWVNPKREIKVALIQNYQWDLMINSIAPQYTLGDELVYKYDQETSFFGGNEFLNFDTSDLRAPTAAISRIEFEDIYQHYLFPNIYRYDRPYTYFPDINGDFVIRTLQGDDGSREAEYTGVHFTLPYTERVGLDDVFIYGKYNNYALDDENKMSYNDETGNLEAKLLLKQGFYNYSYALKRSDGSVDLNAVGGNFHFTENNYLILVYYRNFGDLYDGIIGIGTANSRNISN